MTRPAGDEDDFFIGAERSRSEGNDGEPNQEPRAEQSGAAAPHSMTLPRMQIRIQEREASWSAALLCRFHLWAQPKICTGSN